MIEKLFWVVVALSSIGAAIFGYHRFKQIRPDLFPETQTQGVSEAERASRISEYQQKSDGLPRAPALRRPGPGQRCTDGYLENVQQSPERLDATRVIENGQPVKCAP